MNYIQTFKDYLLALKPSPSKITVKNYSIDVKHFILWAEQQFQQSFNPQTITIAHIEQFRQQKLQELSERSLERHISSLRKFFQALKLQGMITENPFEAAKSNHTTVESDPFFLKRFKDFLYVYNASNLTIKNYIIDVKQFLTWAQEVTKNNGIETEHLLSRIDEAFVAAYRDQMLAGKTFSPASINRKLSSLRKYLSWAASQNLINGKEALQTNLNRVQNVVSTAKNEMPKEVISEAKMALEPIEKPVKKAYSPFPPLRLAQKLGRLGTILFDTVITTPIAHVSLTTHKAVWSLRGKPLFAKSDLLPHNGEPTRVKNIARSLFSPHAVGSENLPWYEKLIFHAKNTRPNWYKRYHSYTISHYFHWAILMIFMSAIGFGFYNNFVEKPKSSLPALAATAPPRILSFQGRLTDANNNPITSATNLRFAIYNDLTATGSALQWQEVDNVTPDANGVFSVLLGNGTTIPQSLFGNNSSLFLGISVGSTAELTPRQQLATVAYATNAETLQGLPPITNTGNTTNVVLALDGSGNLTIGGSATPIFTASGGQFTLAGKTLTLTTVAGSNTNVQLAPDGMGLVDVQKPLTNTTRNNNIASAVGAVEVDSLFAVLATSSGQSAITVNQNGAGPIFSASSSGTSRFTIANNGALNDSNYTTLGGILYTDASGNVLQTTTSSNTQCLVGGSAPTWTACSNIGQNFWQISNGALVPVNSTVDMLVGGTATTAARFAVLNVNPGGATTVASVSAQNAAGSAVAIDSAGTIQTTNMLPFTIGGATTGSVQISPKGTTGVFVNGSGNVGIGTTSPMTTFDINGTGGLVDAAGVNLDPAQNFNLTPLQNSGKLLVGWNRTAGGGEIDLISNRGAGGTGGYNFYDYTNSGTLSNILTVSPSTIQYHAISTGNHDPLARFDSTGAGDGNTIYLANGTGTFSFFIAGGTNQFMPGVAAGDGGARVNVGQKFFFGDASNTRMVLDASGNVGIGTVTPTFKVDLEGAVKGKALAMFTETGDQAIFTASASGTPEFTIQHNGVLTATHYNTQAGVLYLSDTAGTIAETVQGSTGQCLVSGGTLAPSWTACSSAANNWWNMNNGTLYPINSTFDLLLGASATTSAKFAVLNMTGSGTPTASVSSGLNGTGTYFDANGNIQTVNNMGMTIGGTTTGNITVSPLNGGTGSTFTVNAATTAINSGTVSTNQPTINVFNTTASTVNFAGAANALNIGNAGGTTTFRSATIDDNQATVSLFATPTTFTFGAGATTSLNIGASNTPTFINGNVTLGTNNTNTITPNGLMNADLVPTGNGAINLGSATHYYNTVYANNFVAPVSGGTSGFWSLTNDVIFPVNTYFDLAIGGTSTASADFQVFSENLGGIVAGTATMSGNLSFRGPSTKINLLNGAVLDLQTSVGGDAGLASVLNIANNGNITATGSITTASNVAVNGGTLSTNQLTGNLFNTTATTVNIGGAATVGINLGNASGTNTLNGNQTVGSSATNTVNIVGKFISSLIPNATNTYDLGTNTLAWRNLYISGNYAGFWQRNLGVVSPYNITDDFAVGGTATSSAKFQVFGNTGNATTAGTLTFNSGAQATNLIASRDLQGLTIGDSQTGNVNFNGVNVGIGIPTPTKIFQISQSIGGGGTVEAGNYDLARLTNPAGGTNTAASLSFQSFSAGALARIAELDMNNYGTSLLFETHPNNGVQEETTVERMRINQLGFVGIGASTLGNTQLVVNQTNTSGLGDIFTASASGTPEFTIANDGSIKNTINPNLTDTYNLGSDPNAGGREWNNLYVRQIITPGGVVNAQYWQLNSNVLAPANINYDLAIGGISTASAKFQVIGSGVNAGNTIINSSTTTGSALAITASSLTSGNLLNMTASNPKVNNDAGSLLASANLVNIGSANHTYMTLTNQDLTVSGHKNLITLANVQKVFVYDTAKDADGGRWTSDNRAQTDSWYTEARTAADACIIGTNTRCGTAAFPRKAILVATSTNLYIFDAKDNSLWMQFTGGAHNMLTNSIGTTTGLTALNGEIYISYTGSGTSFGLTTINFINDKSYAYGNNTRYTSANKGIVNRNVSGTGDAVQVETATNAGIVATNANDVSVAVINGETYMAVATGGSANGSVTLIDESDLTFFANFAGNVSSSKVWLTSTGTLYALVGDASTATNYALKAKYNVQAIAPARTNNNQTFDVVYATQSTSNYGVTTTDNNTFGSLVLFPGPAATTAAQMNATSLYVTQGTSTNDGVSNTIYIGEGGLDGAVAALQENQASPAAGTIKYFKKNFITGDMVGDMRGYWPMNETTGNLADASIRANTLIASTSGITYSASGVRGTAVTLDGTSGYFYCPEGSCGGINSLDVSGNGKQISVGAWIKTSVSANRQVIVSKFNSGIDGSYLLTVEPGGKVMWALNGLSPNLYSIRTVADGNWHYVVATYDGANMDIYIDGQLNAQQGRTIAFSQTSEDFAVGAYFVSNFAAGWFNGSIDGPFVSATPMEASEITHDYQVGYRALQMHGTQTIRGTTIAADASQQLNGNGNVTAAVTGMNKNHLYVGTNNGISVIGLDSDSINDVYNNGITTTDDIGNTWALNNNYVNSISIGQSFGNGNILVFGSNNAGSGGTWMESQDTLLKDVLATSYNPFGSNLTQSNLNVDTVLRVSNQLSTRLNNLAIDATSSAAFADAFRVDNQGMLLARSLIGSTTAMQFNDASNNTVLNIDTTNDRVGIGTTTPASPLTVAYDNSSIPDVTIGSGANVKNYISFSGGRTMVGYDGSNATLNGGSGHGLALYVNGNNSNFPNGTEAMFINSTGNVGIGTTNPTAAVHVYQNAANGNNFLLQNASANAGAYAQIQYKEDSEQFNMGIASSGNISIPSSFFLFDINGNRFDEIFNSIGGLGLGVGTNSQIGNTALLINQQNLSGLGDIISASASGVKEFTVSNSGVVTGSSFQDLQNTAYFLDPAASGTSLTTAGSVGIGTTTVGHRLVINDGNGGLYYDGSAVTSGYTSFITQDDTGIKFGHNSASRDIEFETNSAAKMTITSGGLVGVGTTSPDGQLETIDAGCTYSCIETNNNGLQTSTGHTTADYTLYMGADKTHGLAYIQSVHWGTATSSLTLNARGGFTGVDTSSPSYNLDVLGNNAGACSSAGCFMQRIQNTNSGANSNGLVIQLNSRGTGNDYIAFAGGTGTPSISGYIGGSGTGVAYNATGGDYGEYFFNADPTATPSVGTIVSSYPYIKQAIITATNSAQLIGVVSDRTAFVGNNIECPFGVNNNDCFTKYREKNIIVGLLGQIPVNISSLHGDIQNGDHITASNIPGYGLKQTEAGENLGFAIQSTSELSSSDYNNNNCPIDDRNLKDPNGNPIKCGQVMVYVHPGWYDPQVQLATTGNLQLTTITPSADFTVPTYYSLNDVFGNPVGRMGAFLELAVANLRAGSIQAQQTITGTLAVTTDSFSIAGQSLRSYILNVVQSAGFTSSTLSPIASVDQLHTNLISPLASNSAVAIDLTGSKFTIRNSATGSAVASIDNAGNATFSGTLNSQNLAVNSDATISGTLHAHKILADDIEGLSAVVSTLSAQNITNVTNIYFATPSGMPTGGNIAMGQNTSSSSTSGSLMPSLGYTNLASYSSFLAYVPNLSASTAVFDQGLSSLGPTVLSDTTVTGQLSVGATLTIADNSINVLGQSLQIQPLRQGGVNFEGGLLAIDTDGNLTVNGNAVFGKTLAAHIISPLSNNDDLTFQLGQNPTASGAALATANLSVQNASGSGIFSIDQLGNVVASGAANIAKLNFNLVQPALAVSDTEVIATGSAGTTIIKAHQTEVTIDNPQVTSKSLIYITPVGQSVVTPYLIRQVSGTSFTVGVSLPQNISTSFNWLIVN